MDLQLSQSQQLLAMARKSDSKWTSQSEPSVYFKFRPKIPCSFDENCTATLIGKIYIFNPSFLKNKYMEMQ
jgi:hypothetical protein